MTARRRMHFIISVISGSTHKRKSTLAEHFLFVLLYSSSDNRVRCIHVTPLYYSRLKVAQDENSEAYEWQSWHLSCCLRYVLDCVCGLKKTIADRRGPHMDSSSALLSYLCKCSLVSFFFFSLKQQRAYLRDEYA